METVAVILTGGRSSRMGRDKCALRLGGETFLERLVERYRGAFGRVCVSVDRPGRFDPAGAEEVCDRRPRPPGTAGRAGGRFSADGGGGDFPDRRGPAVWRRGAGPAAGAAAGTATPAAPPRRGALEPLFAVYGRGCLGAASACLEEGRRAFRGMLERVDCRTVDEAELPGFDLERILLNVNRPEDYAAARAAAEEAEG